MEVKCPNCFYETDSWNDFVSINNVLECPECEEHFILEALTLKQNQQDRLNWDTLANSLEKKVFRIRELEKKLATAVKALENIRDAEYQFAEGYNYDSDSVIINGEECSPDELQKIAKQTLAEIGGDDE